MGNDGGSIARRDELVKVKATTNSKSQAKSTQRQKWTTCALSKQPLREPVVADALGRMYNKEAVTEWLIESVTGGARDESAEMNHIKGLKDLTTLKLTPNPSYKRDAEASNGTVDDNDDPLPSAQTPYACPLTSRPMNGTQRFVYIRTPQSGAVISESALKAVVQGSSDNGDAAICPVTETPFNAGSLASKKGLAASDVDQIGHVILLNPLPGSHEEQVLVAANNVAQAAASKEKDKKKKDKKGKANGKDLGDKGNGNGKRKRDRDGEDGDKDKKPKQ